MVPPRRTTKQIAEKYKGNLDYYRRPHRFRTAKLICFLLAAGASIAVVALPHRQELYSTGPISANHARFANDCAVCHEGAQPSLLRALHATGPGPDGQPEPVTWSERGRRVLASVQAKWNPAAVERGVNGALSASASLTALDAACLKCHEPMKLHQPQAAALGLRPVRQEISAAEVASCSSCHREHEGPERMEPPPSSNCVDCHGQLGRLQETLVNYRVHGQPPPPTGAVTDFKKDNVRRFVPPRPSPHRPVAFASFRGDGRQAGHPPFGYEQDGLRDPAAIAFNHARHAQSDIPAMDGHTLACTDCHTPGADGAFMQRVTYEKSCSRCHSLHFSSDLPELKIPHADPQKVRDTLSSAGLTVLFQDYAVNRKKLLDRVQQEMFIIQQFKVLQNRGINTTEALLARVFRTGDPPNTRNQFFPACAKCHQLTDPGGGATPLVTRTNIADRWLVRGPFSHAPHTHMACTDCHGAALGSSRTSDILLPPQSLCAECHRPLEGHSDRAPFQKIESGRPNPELVRQQMREGGISGECVFCHPRYHAPADSTVFIKGAERIAQ